MKNKYVEQNFELAKLIINRTTEDCKVVIESSNEPLILKDNGFKNVIDSFKDSNYFEYINLKNTEEY